MDDILFFGSDTTTEQEELPWGKDWVKSASNPSIPMEVITAYLGDKGILLETTEYKVFLFRKQQVCKFVQEALEHWAMEHTATKPLIAAYLNKKLQLGIKQSGKDVAWFREENKFYSRRVDDTPSVNGKYTINPFLSPTVPHSNETPSSSKPKPGKQSASSAA